MTFLAIRKLLAGVPWQVWAAAGLALAFWGYGHHQYNAGKQVVIDRLEKAEAKAKADAIKAARSADVKQQERAVEFEARQDILSEAINDAETDNRNPIDALFGGM